MEPQPKSTPLPSNQRSTRASVSITTPHRHPSVRLDHTPTQSQLNWPSVHRSYSSTAATRDSSCGPRPSSSSLGPGSGSAVRARGRDDRPRSSARGIPLLVDVAETAANDRSSTMHSLPTTAMCTPRDFATPPPIEEIEAEAERLSREELVSVVDALRTENLVTKNAVMRDREAYAALKEGMRETYTSVERTQESITNTLMRRLDAAKKVKERLAQSLSKVEQEKAREEMRLQATQRNITRLTRHLKREEGEINAKMQEQLQYLQSQRAQLGQLLAAQTDSLQQLERLVKEVQEMDAKGILSGGVTVSASSFTPSRRDSTLSQGSEKNSALNAVPSTINTNANVDSSAQALDKEKSLLMSDTATTVTTATTTSSAAGAPPFQRSNSSQMSASVATATSVPTEAVAYNSREMVSYLEQEIDAVQNLRTEVLDRAETYAAKAKRLEEKVAQELRNRQHQQRRVQDIKQELVDTSTAVRELSTQHELSLEMESERLVNNAARAESLSRRTNASNSGRSTPRGPGLTDALLMPTSAKYVNPAAIDAFQNMRAASSGGPGATGAVRSPSLGSSSTSPAVPPVASGGLSHPPPPPPSQTRPPVTGAVNLADVVLVPGTERYAIPATSVAALTPNASAGQRGTPRDGDGVLTHNAAYVPISQRPAEAPAAPGSGPNLLDALLIPGSGKYTAAIDPTNAATNALRQQLRVSTGHTPSPSPAPAPERDAKEASGAQPLAASRISVQDTSRMTPARPLSSAEATPKKAPSVSSGEHPPSFELDHSSQ